MNKPVTIVFALLMSITTVAEEKPSKEDTITWLYDKIAVIDIPEFNHPPDDDYEYYVEQRWYRIDFPEDGTMIKIDSTEFKSWKHSLYGFRKYEVTASAKLSDISSHVEIKTLSTGELGALTENYIDIRLSCSLKDCFNTERTDAATYYNGEVKTYNNPWKSMSITIPRAMADRVQKALSHLITLSGGKEKVSEDLF